MEEEGFLRLRGKTRFWWPVLNMSPRIGIILAIPGVPTISVSTSVIAETLASETITATVPAPPTVAASTAVEAYTDTGAATMTIASPCVVTQIGAALADDREIFFRTAGTLPTGITAFTHYFVKRINDDTFNLAATAGGASINTSGSQAGVHNLWTKD